MVHASLGHPAGDVVLQVVAERLLGLLRPGDAVARLGGDEFAMMVTGPDAATGAAVAQRAISAICQAIGISHYLVPPGAGLAKGIELAECIAGNAPMTNFAVTHVLPRIAAADPAGGYVTEALISAIAQGDDEAKARLKAFLEKRAPKTVRN